MTEPVSETTNTQGEGTATNANAEEQMQAKTFTQDELNDVLRKRINEVNAKNDEKVKQAVAEAIKEHERQAKLTAEEKAAEETKARQDELARKEHDLAMRENRADARELLQEKGMSLDLLEYVVSDDSDLTRKNIAKLEKTWNKAVEDGVNKKMAGRTPTDPATSIANNKAYEEKTSTAALLGF